MTPTAQHAPRQGAAAPQRGAEPAARPRAPSFRGGTAHRAPARDAVGTPRTGAATPAATRTFTTDTTPAASPAAATAAAPAPAPWYRRAAQAVGEWAGDTLAATEALGWQLLRRHVPELVPILQRGPQGLFDWLGERVTAGLNAVFERAMAPVRQAEGVALGLMARFAPLLAWAQDAAGKIARNDCSPLREAAERIDALAVRIVQPIVERVQPLIARAEAFFSGLWQTLGAPVWAWLQRVAAEQWQQLQQVAGWIWDRAAPVRQAAAAAWTWLKNRIGIGDGPEGRNGILQWVQARVGAAWERLSARLAPFRREIATTAAVIAGVAVLVSPAGPLVAAGALFAGAVQGLRWVRTHWRGNVLVQARAYLQQTLLPGLVGLAQRIGAAMTGVATRLAAAVQRLADRMGALVGAVAGSALAFAVAAVQWVARQLELLAQWATLRLLALAGRLQVALEALQHTLQRVLHFLGRLGRVVVDIWGLPVLLAERVWNRIPACIRDPVVDFIVPIILRQIEIFRELARDNDAWQRTRKDIHELVRLVFKDHDLMGAVKATFRLVLRVFNVPVALAATVLRKAMAAWDQVMARPIAFIKNSVRAIGSGFRRLWLNLREHLAYGVEGWLFGELADKGIRAPARWSDPMQVFGFVLDVLGLSMDHLFDLMKKRFDEQKVEKLRRVYGHVRGAVAWVREAIDTSKTQAENTRGLVDKAQEFGKAVLAGVVEWIAGKVAQELALMAAAAAASAGLSQVLDVLRRIYRAIQSAVRYMARMLEMLNRVLDTVLDIVSGAIEKAGERLEAAMHTGMPVVIGFLANQVGLGGIGQALRDIVDTLRQKVDEALLWLIDRLKAGLDALIAGVRTAAQSLLQWWKKRIGFRAADGEQHHISLEGAPPNTQVFVESDRTGLSALVAEIQDAGARAGAEKQRDQLDATLGTLSTLDAEMKTREAAGQDTSAVVARINTEKEKVYKQLDTMAQLLVASGVLDGEDASQLQSTAPGFGTPPLHRSQLIPGAVIGGTSMEAGFLTAQPFEAGTHTGSSSEPFWLALKPPGAAQHPLRQGHLLNRLLGGSGTDWRNLTPLTSSGNATHNTRAERDVKSLLLNPGNQTQKRRALRYHVRVNYPAFTRPATLPAQHTDAFRALLRQEMASSLTVTWQQLRRRRGAPAWSAFGPARTVDIPNT